MDTNRLIRYTAFASTALLVGLVGSVLVRTLTSTWDVLSFNPFALLSLAALLCNSILLFLVNRPKHKTPETFWFSLFLAEIVYWAFCEMMQRLSSTPEASIAWYSITSVGWVFLGATYWLYVLQVTGNIQRIRNVFGMLALLGASIGFLVVTLTTSLIVNYDPGNAVANPWGYYAAYGPFFNYFLIWFEMFFVASLIMMYRHYRSAKDPKVKRQALFSSIALLVPLVVGSFTDGLLPALGIYVIPLAVPLTSIQAAITGYAIIKYRIFTFNPNTVASTILEGMNEVVLILNEKRVIEYVNERAYAFLGYADNALIGLDIDALLRDKKQADNFKAQILVTDSNERFETIHMDIQTQAGESKPVIISSAQIIDPNGGEVSFVLVMTDLSQVQKVVEENKILEDTKLAMINALEDAQKLEEALKREKASVEQKIVVRTHQLAEEQARLNASINSLQIGFMIVNNEYELLSVNAATYAILSTKPSTTFGFATVADKLEPATDLRKQIQKVITTKKTTNIKELMWGGKYVRIFISPVVTEKKEAIGAVVLLQDITEEKILQRSREEFFSIASHELRTPLTAIRGNTSMIQDYFAKVLNDNADMKDMITDIHNSSIRLIEIVNDFLDATRLEQGGMEFKYEDVDVAKITDLVAYEMQSVAQEKKLYIKNVVGKQPAISADGDRVKQIIYNLVGNAMKFTDTGGINVSAETNKEYLRVRITDTGRGIPEDKQILLFRKFQQAGNSLLTRDSTRGTGLGLYISKLLVEHMGGTINIESSVEGKGTVFYFELPLSGSKAASRQHTVKAPEQSIKA
jgi:PAS domain S-box-containing protein